MLSINVNLAITSRAIFWKTSLTLTKVSTLVTISKWSIIWVTPPSSKSNIPLIFPELKVGLRPFLRSWISSNGKCLSKQELHLPLLSVRLFQSPVLLSPLNQIHPFLKVVEVPKFLSTTFFLSLLFLQVILHLQCHPQLHSSFLESPFENF